VSTANRLAIDTSSVAKTRSLARRVARLLRAGDVLLLQGPLGAGKTAFTQGLAKGLHLPSDVTSPTFILVAAHPAAEGGLALYHADLYRLTDPFEVADLHLEEQAADGVLVIEWPERAFEELPPDHLLIVIEPDDGDLNGRRFTFVATGDRHREIVDGLQARA